jgi:addiction module RelE/StbE family toxin
VNLLYTDKFAKEYKTLPGSIKNLAEKIEQIFRKNPYHPSLKTHKLKGKLKNFHSFSVTYQYRIVFHFKDDSTVIFDNIGTHEVYK